MDPRPVFPKMMPSLGLQLLNESDGSPRQGFWPKEVSLQLGYAGPGLAVQLQWLFPQVPELTASQQILIPAHAPVSSLPAPAPASSPLLPGPGRAKPLSPSSLHCTHWAGAPSLPPAPLCSQCPRLIQGCLILPGQLDILLLASCLESDSLDPAPIITHQFNKQGFLSTHRVLTPGRFFWEQR